MAARRATVKSRLFALAALVVAGLYLCLPYFGVQVTDVIAVGAVVAVIVLFWLSRRAVSVDERPAAPFGALGPEEHHIRRTILLGRVGIAVIVASILPVMLGISGLLDIRATLAAVGVLFATGGVIFNIADRLHRSAVARIETTLPAGTRAPYF
jgi:hypothetical protein